MSDEEDEAVEDFSSSDDDDIIDELNGWMILEEDPDLGLSIPDSSSSDDETDASERVDFDTTMPSKHSYLGDEMEELHGRTIHDEDKIVKMPLLPLPGVTLVPGQIIPLRIFNPQLVAMMRKVLQADRTFGLARPQAANIGTTAEIFSVKEELEYGISTIRMKAAGKQRFRVLGCKRQLDGVMLGDVKILEEVSLPSFPSDCIVCSYKRKPNYVTSRTSSQQWHAANTKWVPGRRRSEESFPKTCVKRARTSLSAFPYWVYQQYNPFLLMDQLFAEIRSWNTDLESKNLPIDPNEFSHWLTANLPLDDTLRHSLLGIDCSVVRLRRQLDIIKKYSGLQCAKCGNAITNKKELFSMSVNGPLGAYVNPGGYVHETVTFYKARGLHLRGSPSAQDSWFPGYAWTIAECSSCSTHMGWRFTSCTKGLIPSKFWGLTRASLKQELLSDDTP